MSTDFSSQATPTPASPFTTKVAAGDNYLNTTATGLIKTGEGWLIGVNLNSGAAATIKLWDNTAGSGTVIVNTYTLNSGWNPLLFHFRTGLYVTVGGAADLSFSYS